MSIVGRIKAKAQELLGRAEQVYGESHGDAAATVAGEANVMEAQAEEEELERDRKRDGDDGLAPAR
ncbi:hypothetical protein [Blastococcus sp. CCUG 61487]|uniref:hypothetical protein n=1 Tax=Blastococcus sp. CCUG 61487 TaxID=1840703 RepID=UPI0010C0BDF9|nr:hypothetical protein [Blastococcus sp. CCUG 61487]TKJ22871.1 hypothetical protein A6V29_06115 [Blastococcus sp. CCUG 61487]